jgi:LmbE family N-acetylglucosaminyl deacetylase
MRMKLPNTEASIYVADSVGEQEALARITHLGIGAHPDDLEIMACHGILACYDDPLKWFGGITCTDGSGSVRTGRFAGVTDDEMRQIRSREQIRAAELGRYGIMIQLGYPSAQVRGKGIKDLTEALHSILSRTRPEVVYTHNPADRLETHVSVCVATVQAIRKLKPERRPGTVYGCEVWRDLDWLPPDEIVALDVGGCDNLGIRLLEVFESQIAGGKNYVQAALGRRKANATFFQAHSADRAEDLWFAMDLSPLVKNESLDMEEYVVGFIEKFKADVKAKLKKCL